LYAARSTAIRNETATVVSVATHETPTNYVGDSPTDAPLQVQSYSYDITLRTGCASYITEYDTPIDYLPSAFVAGGTLDIVAKRHTILANLPTGEEALLIIHHRRRFVDSGCSNN
jgi:hypothetical protein